MSSSSESPSGSFRGIIRFVRLSLSCLGCDFYDENYRFNIITVIPTVSIVLYLSLTIWTVVEEPSWMFGLQVCCMNGSVIQASNKLYTGILMSNKIHILCQELLQVYEQFEKHPDAKYCELLLRNCRRTKRALTVVAIVYALAALGMVATPFILPQITGQHQLILHFHIPGLNVDERWGYLWTQVAHTFCVVIGGFGLYAGDIIIVVYLVQFLVFAEILRAKARALSEYVQQEENDRVTEMLIDIVEWHQRFQDFVTECKNVFHIMISVQIPTSALCIVLTLFVTLTTEWIAAYSYLLCIIPNMYIYCILGTVLENCNDDVMYEIYNISFYEMNVLQQRIVLFMLAKAQQPDEMQVMGVMPLSVSTALAITKIIYSLTMMMVRLLK